MGDVAARVGYGEVVAFRKVFVRMTGLTPAEVTLSLRREVRTRVVQPQVGQDEVGGTVSTEVLVKIVIDRPRGEVASFAGDPSNAPQWYENIKSVEWRTARPVAVGSRIAFVAHFLGRRLAYTYEIVDLPPRKPDS